MSGYGGSSSGGAAEADGFLGEAPQDGSPYARQDAGWVAASAGGGGLSTTVIYDGVLTDFPSVSASGAGLYQISRNNNQSVILYWDGSMATEVITRFTTHTQTSQIAKEAVAISSSGGANWWRTTGPDYVELGISKIIKLL